MGLPRQRGCSAESSVEPSIPFLDHALVAPLVDDRDEARIPGGDELRPVIEGGEADPATGQTSPHDTALVDDQQRAPRGLQCRRGGQSRHPRAHDQHIGSVVEVLHRIVSLLQGDGRSSPFKKAMASWRIARR